MIGLRVVDHLVGFTAAGQRPVAHFSHCAAPVVRNGEESSMAKGQIRGNKEAKKPKKEKQTLAPVSGFLPQGKAADAGKPK